MPRTSAKTIGAVVDVARLRFAPWNPRVTLTPADREWRELEACIQEFGLVQPICVSRRSMIVVGGNQRLAIMLHRGAKTLKVGEDVRFVELPDERAEKRLCLALNKITGRWREDKLADLIRVAVAAKDENVPKDGDLGFSAAEIKRMISSAERKTSQGGPPVQMTFSIVIDCVDERDQRAMLDRLIAEGLKCRALML